MAHLTSAPRQRLPSRVPGRRRRWPAKQGMKREGGRFRFRRECEHTCAPTLPVTPHFSLLISVQGPITASSCSFEEKEAPGGPGWPRLRRLRGHSAELMCFAFLFCSRSRDGERDQTGEGPLLSTGVATGVWSCPPAPPASECAAQQDWCGWWTWGGSQAICEVGRVNPESGSHPSLPRLA